MTRKLFAVTLIGFALVLLMGAGVESSDSALLVDDTQSSLTLQIPASEQAEEESSQQAPEEAGQEASNPKETVSAVAGGSVLTLAEDRDRLLTVNGQPVSNETGRIQRGDTTYVALVPMAQALDPNVQAGWNGGSRTVTLSGPNLSLTATVGQKYLQANGRYLYLPNGVELVEGRVTVPLATLVKAMGATLSWNGATGAIAVTTGSGGIVPGDQFYNPDSLYWLSRVIYTESGNQPLEGQMAVGNVILNRVNSPIFPNTIEGVLAQKNQFTTYGSGALARCNPDEESFIAAKLVLDGGVVESVRHAYYFDSAVNSWASRNKTCVAVIGGHKFYG